MLFPDANIVDPSYYQLRSADRGEPGNFDGTRRAAAAVVPVGRPGRERAAEQRLSRASPTTPRSRTSRSASPRCWGRHTLKTGYLQAVSAAQAAEPGQPVRHAELRQRRATTRSTPAFGFANAALGIFSSYNQASTVRRGAVHLHQRRGLHPGQLEGHQPADARLRHAVRAPAAAVRHDRAGVQLPARGVDSRGAAPRALRRRLRQRRLPVHRHQPPGA